MQQAPHVSDMKAFFNSIEYEEWDVGKVGYLFEYGSKIKIFNSHNEKSTQGYIFG